MNQEPALAMMWQAWHKSFFSNCQKLELTDMDPEEIEEKAAEMTAKMFYCVESVLLEQYRDNQMMWEDMR